MASISEAKGVGFLTGSEVLSLISAPEVGRGVPGRDFDLDGDRVVELALEGVLAGYRLARLGRALDRRAVGDGPGGALAVRTVVGLGEDREGVDLQHRAGAVVHCDVDDR